MKIFCVGRNYADHAKELKNSIPTEPVIFLKPDTAIPVKRQPFFYPSFSEEIHYEVELLIKINRIGKNIQEKFAHKYYSEISVGIDFTARDIQKKLKANGLPWDIAKGFDGSAPIGQFIDKNQIDSTLGNLTFSLQQNGKEKQIGCTKDMLFSIDKLISHISNYYTLKIGDIIFTGTPAGVGAIQKGDTLTAFIEQKKLLEIKVR